LPVLGHSQPRLAPRQTLRLPSARFKDPLLPPVSGQHPGRHFNSAHVRANGRRAWVADSATVVLAEKTHWCAAASGKWRQ